MKPTRQQLVDSMAEAMAREEGFYVQGSPAQVNRNPGNLREWGNCPINRGYAVFPTVAAGWAALKGQITVNIWGHSGKEPCPLRISQPMGLVQFFSGQRDAAGNVLKGGYSGYSPVKDGNDPQRYARFVLEKISLALKLPAEITVETPIRGIAND